MSVSPPILDDLMPVLPEVILALWGLVVLLVDVAAFRGRSPAMRNRAIGRLSIVGVALALAMTLLAASPPADASLFEGTLLGGLLVERLNALLLVLLLFVVWLSTAREFTEHVGEYYALMLWSAVGMMVLVAAEELLTLFLSLETMTICLYLAIAFEAGSRRSAEAGLKYFLYGSVSSALFLFGLSLLYGLAGTTRLEGIGRALATSGGTPGLAGNLAGASAVLLVLVGFGFKIAAAPFHQWAPDAYEGGPVPVVAWLATGSKLASVVALLKVFVQALGPWGRASDDAGSPGWVGLVALIAALTMTYGNFAALAQSGLKRLLAYSSIAHAGYLLVGVLATVVAAEPGPAAGAVLFYLVVYSSATLGAFALVAWLDRETGSDAIERLDGLGLRHPGYGVCVVLIMLSLIGLPGLAGFFGKVFMFSGAIDQVDGRHRLTFLWLVGLGLFNSAVSAIYYVRILRGIFLRPSRGVVIGRPPLSVAAALVVAAGVSLVFGLNPRPLARESRALGESRAFFVGGRDSHAAAPAPGRVERPEAPAAEPAPVDETAPPAPTPLPSPK